MQKTKNKEEEEPTLMCIHLTPLSLTPKKLQYTKCKKDIEVSRQKDAGRPYSFPYEEDVFKVYITLEIKQEPSVEEIEMVGVLQQRKE